MLPAAHGWVAHNFMQPSLYGFCTGFGAYDPALNIELKYALVSVVIIDPKFAKKVSRKRPVVYINVFGAYRLRIVNVLPHPEVIYFFGKLFVALVAEIAVKKFHPGGVVLIVYRRCIEVIIGDKANFCRLLPPGGDTTQQCSYGQVVSHLFIIIELYVAHQAYYSSLAPFGIAGRARSPESPWVWQDCGYSRSLIFG